MAKRSRSDVWRNSWVGFPFSESYDGRQKVSKRRETNHGPFFFRPKVSVHGFLLVCCSVLSNTAGCAFNCPAPFRVIDSDPAFSPDGTKIAFLRNMGRRDTVWVMDANGDRQHCLHAGGLDDYPPSWYPDSKAVVFSTVGFGCLLGAKPTRLIVDLSGKLLKPVPGMNRLPGSHLYFHQNVRQMFSWAEGGLYTLDKVGTPVFVCPLGEQWSIDRDWSRAVYEQHIPDTVCFIIMAVDIASGSVRPLCSGSSPRISQDGDFTLRHPRSYPVQQRDQFPSIANPAPRGQKYGDPQTPIPLRSSWLRLDPPPNYSRFTTEPKVFCPCLEINRGFAWWSPQGWDAGLAGVENDNSRRQHKYNMLHAVSECSFFILRKMLFRRQIKIPLDKGYRGG